MSDPYVGQVVGFGHRCAVIVAVNDVLERADIEFMDGVEPIATVPFKYLVPVIG